MSSRGKNNHYHYAEKFEDRRRRQSRASMPKRAVFLACLLLLMFGIITTTFASYVDNSELSDDSDHSILVDIRTAKLQKDIALVGANVDLASSGYSVNSGAIIYFDTTGWDTATYSHVQVMIGGSGYSDCYDLTRFGTTNLYYITGLNYGSFGQLCFIATTDGWGHENNEPNNRKGYAGCYTNTWGSSNVTNTKWFFKKASSSNDANLTAKSDGSYNTLLNSTFNLYAATKTGSGSYSAVNSGGNASMAGTTKNTTDTTSTTSFEVATGNVNPAVNYPMVGTAVTLSNTPNTGYKFDQYNFDSAGTDNITGSPINMTSAKNETTTVYACFSEVLHNIEVSTNIPGDSSTTYNNCIGVVTDKALTAPTKAGYTFTGWSSMPSGVTFITNGGSTSTASIDIKYSSSSTSADTITLVANYSINAPTAVSITDADYTIGETAVSLSPSVTIEASDATAVNTYSIVDANNSDASAVAAVDSSGNFSATKPGVYTVTLSARSSITDGTDTLTSSDSTTDTATVTVYPAKPTWELTMSGFDPSGDLYSDEPDNPPTQPREHPYGFHVDNPYLVTLGSNFSFTAEIKNPPNDNNYVYTWYTKNGESWEVLKDSNNQNLTGSTVTFGADTASEATLADIHVEVRCIVSYTGAATTATSDSIGVYYYIQSLVESFEVPSMQKIYSSPNSAKLEIKYTINSATGYTTNLFFSPDNYNFTSMVQKTSEFLGTLNATTEKYEYQPSAAMNAYGPKYFYLQMTKSGASAKTDVLHTTVGSTSSVGNRPIYLINNTGLDFSAYRVMAFYLDANGDVKYQTAQDVFKGRGGTGISAENKRFRAMIPSDATKIRFAVAKPGKYSIPELSNNELNFGSDVSVFYYAYCNGWTVIDTTHNTITANANPTNIGSAENPLYTIATSYVSTVTTGE